MTDQKNLNLNLEGQGSKKVTLIGLGPMGQAMGNAFLNEGYELTVWNRTLSKADELAAKGAIKASSVTEALEANELVILSLTSYDAMYTILEPAAASLQGKVIVNLSSDTPHKAREAAKWLGNHGAIHITGGVQVPPSGIGSPESFTFYSGPREVFEANKKTLEVLTSTDYRGEEPGLAALYYQLQMDIFWTSMVSYFHAITVAKKNGITAEEFLSTASGITAALPQFIQFYTPRIDADEHPGNVDRLFMGLASVEHVLHTTEEAGVDSSLPAAVLELFKRGMQEGYHNNSFTSIIKVLEKQETASL
ncbi:NAD(P)-dependent oxidoreductase [Paenibacillus jiagnxiensis]|uniref:NAD(P)-dependent oxidoreductase n=1 Tax=Paenibacillus jiagnxiensis TaxID=3228926 RepID=UPI0033B00C35